MKIINIFVFILVLFSSCQKSLSEKEKKGYIIEGKKIAQASSEHLGGQLTKYMKEGGVVKAIPFCNTMAMPLTDEMSEKYNVSIKRTSHKVRNEKNHPNDEETKILNEYNDILNANEKPGPKVELDKFGNPHFYAPILLQQKCLACHGEIGNHVSTKTDSIIKSYYPDDLATGFNEGDLRGIWSITFKQ